MRHMRRKTIRAIFVTAVMGWGGVATPVSTRVTGMG